MSKITVSILSEDVATLREVFSLALAQSEGTIEDYGYAEALSDAYETHNKIVSLMVALDHALPDSTGFFD